MRWILPVVLLAACGGASALPTTDPSATDDLSDLISQPAPGWKLEHWFNSEPLALEALRGKVVLVRWFMAPSCPFCSATAPALNRLEEEYRGCGLVVIGAYHHKDPEASDVETRARLRRAIPVPLRRDHGPRLPDWQILKRWWLDGHERSWTRGSFLIDRRGVIRRVHLGGKLAPDTDDFRVMRGKIEVLLAEDPLAVRGGRHPERRRLCRPSAYGEAAREC